MANTRHIYVAPFEFVDKKPTGFDELVRFQLNRLSKKFETDFRGDVPIKGFVLFLTEESAKTDKGKPVSFSAGTISVRASSIHLTFRTKTYKGFFYTFDGEYFDTGLAHPERDTTRLKGKLQRLKYGTVVAPADVMLYPSILDID